MLMTEKVSEDYEPRPGVVSTRTFWIAYPDWVAGLGSMQDRISRAIGQGGTSKVARERGERALASDSG